MVRDHGARKQRPTDGRRRDVLGTGDWVREVQRLIEADATALLQKQSERGRLALQRLARAHELLREIDSLFQLTTRAGHGHFHYTAPAVASASLPVRLDLRWRGSPPERSLIVSISAERGLIEWSLAAVEQTPAFNRRDVLACDVHQIKDAIRRLIDHSHWQDAWDAWDESPAPLILGKEHGVEPPETEPSEPAG